MGKKAVKGKQVRMKGGDRYGKKLWRLLKVVCVTYPDSEMHTQDIFLNLCQVLAYTPALEFLEQGWPS